MLQKLDFNVGKIKKYYASEDCIQKLISYQTGLTIICKDGILYHQYKNSQFYVNKYLDDERRTVFPYSNIPVFYGKKNGVKMTCVNQLYNFNEPYIVVSNGCVKEHYVLKGNDEMFLVNRIIKSTDGISYLMTRNQMEKMFDKKNNEELYILDSDGSVYIDENPIISEEKIHENIRKKLLVDNEKIYKKSELVVMHDFIEECIENVDFNNFECNMTISDLYVLKITEFLTMELKRVKVDYLSDDCYRVTEYEIPIRRYSLEMIKCLAKKIYEIKEPKISLWQNKDISRKDLKEAKQRIKKLEK